MYKIMEKYLIQHIPVSNRVNSNKKHAFDSLKGSLKSISSLKEIKEERLRRYEVTN